MYATLDASGYRFSRFEVIDVRCAVDLEGTRTSSAITFVFTLEPVHRKIICGAGCDHGRHHLPTARCDVRAAARSRVDEV